VTRALEAYTLVTMSDVPVTTIDIRSGHSAWHGLPADPRSVTHGFGMLRNHPAFLDAGHVHEPGSLHTTLNYRVTGCNAGTFTSLSRMSLAGLRVEGRRSNPEASIVVGFDVLIAVVVKSSVL
jgi:hypothetical protein